MPAVRRSDLVAEVIHDPDSDEPRRRFAEWGVPRSDPQAELTQLQLAGRDERRRNDLYAAATYGLKAAALLEQHRQVWDSDVRAITTLPSVFYRGFVEHAFVDAPTFLSRAPELYAIAPIRAITFIDAGDHVDAIAASPHLARLVSVVFGRKSRPIGDAGLRTFLASPYLGKLRLLSAPFNDIGGNGMEALCAAHLPSLIYANLGNNRVDSPQEECAFDNISGLVNNNSISLPKLGRELEAKYGPQPWLHAPSLLSPYPPNEGDV